MLKAAQYLGVSPLELLAMPYEWQARAEVARSAENWAQEERSKRDRK